MRRALVAGGVALALLPFVVPSQFLVSVAVLTALSAFLGQAWNIAGGFGGLFSFGHAAFFGIGAYAGAIVQTRYGINPWLGLPTAAACGALAGGLIGLAVARAGLRGSYFALVTLAFAEAFKIVANSVGFTRGGLGILIPLDQSLANLQFADRRAFYALALALMALGTLVAWWLTGSRFGARLMAVRDNEDAAMALGVDVVRTKATALAISGALAAMGGAFYAQYFLYIDPHIAFGAERSVEMLLVAMVGGAGSVWGPVIGSVALHALADTTRAIFDIPGLAPILYGVVLLAIVRLAPGGLVGWATRRA